MAVNISAPYQDEEGDELRYSKGRITLSLDGTQRLTLRRVLQGCIDGDVTLTNGTVVKSPGDAVKHLLELVAAGA